MLPTRKPKMTMNNGQSTIWRCISYWKWICSNVMLIFRFVCTLNAPPAQASLYPFQPTLSTEQRFLRYGKVSKLSFKFIISRRFVVPHFEIQPNPPYPSMFHQDLFALELLPTDLRYWWSFDSTSTCQARKIPGLAMWWSRFLPVSFNNWCDGWGVFHVPYQAGALVACWNFAPWFAKKTYHITYTQED